MVFYRRNPVPGGTFFFTVTLDDRRASLLVEHFDALRGAFRIARRERPFAIVAIVVLPDHLHAILTLPPGDADLERHVDYIHFNPVRHGLVGHVKDWPYSSFTHYVGRGILSMDWGGGGGIDDGDFGEPLT